MSTYNPSSYSRRVYWITDPGKRLAMYLDYCAWQPSLTTDIAFADMSGLPEHHDDDRPETTLQRLYRQMQEALDDMKAFGWRDEAGYLGARQRYDKIKDQIWHLENDPSAADDRDDFQPQDPGQAGYERDDIPGWILNRDDDDDGFEDDDIDDDDSYLDDDDCED